MRYAGLSDQGKTRPENQDSYLVSADDNGDVLGVVCDGVGGGNHGETASHLAAECLAQRFEENSAFRDLEDAQAWLYTAINQANSLICQRGNENAEYKGMMTTMVAVLATSFGSIIANVGDSRAYALYDDRTFRLVTNDHTYVAGLIQSGQISLQEAQKHPQRHVITNAIGIGSKANIDFFNLDPAVRSVLLCSDGLHGYVSENEIAAIVRDQRMNADTKVRRLINAANNAGGYDNVTAVIVEIQEAQDHE